MKLETFERVERLLSRSVLGAAALCAALLALWIGSAFVWNCWVPFDWRYRHAIARAEALAEEVKAFRASHGRLPAPAELRSMDLTVCSPMTGCISIQYWPSDDRTSYRAGFVTGFGEVHAYEPEAGRWLEFD